MRNYLIFVALILTIGGFIYPINGHISRADSEGLFAGYQNSASTGAFSARRAVNRVQIIKAWITAYSSTPEETDDTPFITASGKSVRDGIVATNFLPFGTKIMIPGAFGGKIFIVEDRMHPRKVNVVDIWMPSKEQAKNFGSAYMDIIVVSPMSSAKQETNHALAVAGLLP